MDDFTKRRWEQNGNPAAFMPAHAIEGALGAVEGWQPDHAMVVLAKRLPDGTTVTKVIQAGSYDGFAQMGVLWQALDTFR